ncbi:anthranilate phosphoribosyltransferase [Methanoplanus sp. FWC-SCC4]|uniref:Anthranilate phosphoribosyltransferase n=1 Tax=Methanochimaera problematica TaxID=2609417 RepID=A0AA97FBK7_9EURY|nr:anthranilate phosphoribosyltransferase [Methanoplanus sp. FWC-SCC4]WOF16435.1 anthranilate phosphoribosyltransferase [Methanoplanus sp. FWC-SCC4]
MISACIGKITENLDLTFSEAKAAMDEIMCGNATDSQIGSFITALRMKGENAEEIAAFANAMRRSSVRITPKTRGVLLDTCGTGGDKKDTFNISTAAAFVAAGAGLNVVKHGNSSISSRCGSADVLKEAGVATDISPEQVCRIIEENGIGFLYAQTHHPAMRYAGKVRKEIGIRSIFNLLGPLTNPAGADAQLMGVYDESLTLKTAEVLRLLGTKSAMVVNGDGYDEITTTGITKVSELREGKITSYEINPSSFGFERASESDLKGGDPKKNAEILFDILNGVEGPKRDIVLLNAGAAIYTGFGADSLEMGIRMAEKSIDSGKAGMKLENLIRLSGGRR